MSTPYSASIIVAPAGNGQAGVTISPGGLPGPAGASGGALEPVATQTGNYDAAAGQYVPVSTVSAAVTITLPATPADQSVAAVYMVTQGGGNAVTLAASGSDKFAVSGEPATLPIAGVNEGFTVQYDASAGLWYVLSTAGGGSGTVTSVAVESANGLAGTVADATTTPQITLRTSVTGLLKGNGTAISAATAGTDYLAPAGSGAALTGITVGQVSGAAPLASPALTGSPTAPTGTPGDNSTQIATDAFVTAAVNAAVQGLSIKASVQEATAAALPANTYSNGASGVGATLTAIAAGVLTVDGIAVALGDRVLVQNEVAASHNGIYLVSALGTVSVAYILTRTTDMNTAAEIPGAFAFTEQGTVNAGAGFVVASEGPFTVGTTSITWTQFSSAGAGLPLTGGTMSGAIAMGSNKVTGLTNGSSAQDAAAFGQLPSSGTPLALTQGGTGLSAASAGAILTALGAQVSQLYGAPAGATGETVPRSGVTVATSSLTTSGTIYMTAILLAQGILINDLTFITGTGTLKTGGTHGWYVLTDSGLVVRAASADQTDPATVWGTASTPYPLAMSNSYTTTYTGLYYAGVMVATSAGSQPNLVAATSIAAGLGIAPVLSGPATGAHGTGQTTPPATNGTVTLGAITPDGSRRYYAYTS
jgi:hypothetical protein